MVGLITDQMCNITGHCLLHTRPDVLRLSSYIFFMIDNEFLLRSFIDHIAVMHVLC